MKQTHSSTPDMPIASAHWPAAIAPYQKPDLWRSSWQLLNSIVPYLVLWYAAYRLLELSWWATLGVSVLAAAFLIRVFVISHDCGHGSFFRSKAANAFWGSITSALPFLPYHAWRHYHALHHAHSGDLDNRGVGDIVTRTVEEYQALSRWQRLLYRLYRHPAVMFGLGPLFTFVVAYRFWRRGSDRRVRMSVIRTNIVLALAVAGMAFLIGPKALLLVQLPIMYVAGAMGIWLFYVQHQFEGVYWERQENWSYLDQALGGSSYYALPRVLQWFTGNIGFHHVHHLGARIPNYRLEKCHNELALFRDVRPISLVDSRKCLRFRLWDEQSRRLIGFGEAGRILAERESAA
jgi:omega-6 fatty acid desaturase (delta-12 desaturase)